MVGENQVVGTDHPVHICLGKLFERLFEESRPAGCALIKDVACGGTQHIPLFYTVKKAWATQLCNVDMLVVKQDKIRLIVEIEESNVKPTQICGKFLTSALAQCFIHETGNDEPIMMDESVTFLQIVDTSRLAKGSTKYEQWNTLESLINRILPLKGSKIRNYSLLCVDETGLSKTDERARIISVIQRACL